MNDVCYPNALREINLCGKRVPRQLCSTAAVVVFFGRSTARHSMLRTHQFEYVPCSVPGRVYSIQAAGLSFTCIQNLIRGGPAEWNTRKIQNQIQIQSLSALSALALSQAIDSQSPFPTLPSATLGSSVNCGLSHTCLPPPPS